MMVKDEKVVKGFRTELVATATDEQLVDKDGKVLSVNEALVLVLNSLDRLERGML